MGRTSDARERLVEATVDLVWASSYGAVGVDAICEKAGVKKGSFYHFFPSKDELVVAALDAHWQTRREVLDRLFSASVPPLDRLRRFFAHLYERQNEVAAKYGRVLGCFYNCMGTECIQGVPAIAAKVQDILFQYPRYLETAIRDAQAAGELRAGDPAADAKMLFAYVEGSLAQARIHNDTEILRGIAASGFALIGLTAPPAPAKPTKARKASKTAGY